MSTKTRIRLTPVLAPQGMKARSPHTTASACPSPRAPGDESFEKAAGEGLALAENGDPSRGRARPQAGSWGSSGVWKGEHRGLFMTWRWNAAPFWGRPSEETLKSLSRRRVSVRACVTRPVRWQLCLLPSPCAVLAAGATLRLWPAPPAFATVTSNLPWENLASRLCLGHQRRRSVGSFLAGAVNWPWASRGLGERGFWPLPRRASLQAEPAPALTWYLPSRAKTPPELAPPIILPCGLRPRGVSRRREIKGVR